ncbi:hypothetical protein FRB99_000321 [Tulasnella sp. 403]|nr:hypothetical protein FRB99_000321 [Tulasnella sp. 403]
MVKALLDGTVIAESSDTIIVEGNHYFPPESLVNKEDVYSTSDASTYCPWKGHASYYNVKRSDGTIIQDAAWYYPNTYEKANHIRNYVAFYKNKVTIDDS